MTFEKFVYEDLYEIAEAMYNTTIEEGLDTDFIGDYIQCETILRGILDCDYDEVLTMYDIELVNPEMDEYEGPYILGISGEGLIFCQKAVCENKPSFIVYYADYVYATPEYYIDAIENCENEDAVIYRAVDEEQYEKEPPKDVPRLKLNLIGEREGEPEGTIHGFTLTNDGCADGCFDMTYCTCEPVDIEKLAHQITGLIDAYKNFILEVE